MIRLKLLITLLIFFIYSSKIAQRTDSTYRIKNQVWMTKNLNVVTFQNGDTIPQAQTEAEWLDAGRRGTPAWCYDVNVQKPDKIEVPFLQRTPEKFELNIQKKPNANDEKLYNWYAVTDPRQIAPKGFKVATDEDWKAYYIYIDSCTMESYRKQENNEKLGSWSKFHQVNLNIYQYNRFYRNCPIGGGYVKNANGKVYFKAESKKIKVKFTSTVSSSYSPTGYQALKCYYSWWTPTENPTIKEHAYVHQMYTINGISHMIARDKTKPTVVSFSKACGFFVRCVKITN